MGVEVAEQGGGPRSDRGQRVGAVAIAEELGQHGGNPHAAGVERVASELAGGMAEQPHALVRVVEHGVGQRPHVWVGQQPDHLGET